MKEHLGLVASLAERVGAPEAALRLLITIAAGYPIGFVYRKFVQNLPNKSLHHIFFALCGILLCMFNYGKDTYHSLIGVWTTYILVRSLNMAPKLLIGANFIFHMSYLLVGYYFTESDDYDILWTTPHCVLVLRMIGLAFDIVDGKKPREKLSKEQQETYLEELPSILELMAFAYFPSSFLVGPQFPYRRYKKFIDGDYREFKGSIKAGVKRMLVGVLYLSIRQIGAMWIPDDYLLSEKFKNTNFLLQVVHLSFWGKMSLYKYISCWLLTEGALMCIGFSYNGKNAKGDDDWNGCSNVKLIILETGDTMQHYVHSFNVNTNQWVSQYVYKRLKFLNNRNISYGAALGFLAVWHGFHSGYYMSFLLEYLIVTMEKQMESVYTKRILPLYGELLTTSLPLKALKYITLKSYNIIYMGWCLVPFVFMSYHRWIRILSAVNYFGFIFMAIWIIIYQLHNYQMRSAQRARSEHIFSNATTLSPQVQSTEGKMD